jgi:alcohol dehydrogenase class IV
MWDFTSPRKCIFGEDALEYLSELSFNHAFIVTDPLMRKLHLAAIKEHLSCEITVFDEIPGEPTFQVVQKGVELLVKTQPDVIIALGGGSVMDAAKGMWPMFANPEDGLDAIEGLDPFGILDLRKKTNCILINIPTTSGTGADVTWATVLTDKSSDTDRKASFGNRELVADITILDPSLTKTMPVKLIAGTGLDAICHAVDGYLSTWRNDFSDAFLRHAFKLLWENLPIAVEQAKEKGETETEIREKLQNASTMAGWGFGNSQIIMAHSLAHSIGAVYKVPHSVIIGLACWYSLSYNKDVEVKRISDLSRLVGFDCSTDEALVKKLIDAHKRLLQKLGMPLSLKEIGISREIFDQKLKNAIEYALNDSGTLSNPRPIDYEDYKKVFNYLYEGKELDF